MGRFSNSDRPTMSGVGHGSSLVALRLGDDRAFVERAFERLERSYQTVPENIWQTSEYSHTDICWAIVATTAVRIQFAEGVLYVACGTADFESHRLGREPPGPCGAEAG
jgi:hypothetical protein